jgi:hypothetical protein
VESDQCMYLTETLSENYLRTVSQHATERS